MHEKNLDRRTTAKFIGSNTRGAKAARWIEGKVIGNRYIDCHFEYIIIEPAHWDVE